jgi:hypothetical protein
MISNNFHINTMDYQFFNLDLILFYIDKEDLLVY